MELQEKSKFPMDFSPLSSGLSLPFRLFLPSATCYNRGDAKKRGD
ncbi:hypothetical protein [Megasphaera hominis]|jgi:hypothetical protein|nr:hypothetical protein [Megasphaera hominis]